MPATNAIRTSNTVEFFPHCTTAPVPNQLDTISAILLQLKELLQGNETCSPQGGTAYTLAQLLLDVQSLLGVPSNSPTSKGARTKSNVAEAPIKSPRTGPTTQSKTKQIHPIGTIINKRFHGKYYEGEVEEYFPREDLYKIKYTDGDTEDFTAKEVSAHKKQKQIYLSLIHI